MQPLRPTGPVIRSVSAMKSDTLPARIQRCRVVNVNTRDFTVDIRQEFQPYAAMFDIPFSTPYGHQENGEGIHFMPEPGAIAWVCQPSEEGRDAFVLAFTMINEKGSYRGGRQLLNPGDIHLSTRDGNYIFIRRGGVVQIGSTPICQTVYLPIKNTIQHFAENYEVHTPAGDLTWTVARTEEQGDGHRGCTYTLAAKEFSDDPNKDPVAVLKIGSHGDGNPTILTMQTRDKGGGKVQTTMEITKDGEIKWTMKKFTMVVQGDYSAKIKGSMQFDVTQDAKIISKANALLQGSNAAILGGGVQIAVSGAGAGVTGTSPAKPFNLAQDAAFPVMRWSPDILAWFATVTAALGGPVAGPPANRVGPALLPPTLHINPKVKA
jgi:hypothetical protein